MTSVRRKVQQLTGQQPVKRWEIWDQADDGSDAFTSPDHPGVVMTLAELEARDGPADVGQIVIVSEDARPPERTP